MKISKRMVLSSIVCVLPLVVSALLYRQLPNQMPIHWNSVGEANGFIGKISEHGASPFLCLPFTWLLPLKPKMTNPNNTFRLLQRGFVFGPFRWLRSSLFLFLFLRRRDMD